MKNYSSRKTFQADFLGENCRTEKIMTEEQIQEYLQELHIREKSQNTILSYGHALRHLKEFAGGQVLSKNLLLDWKEALKKSYASSSINGMIAAVNGFLRFRGEQEMIIKPLKLQKVIFLMPEKVLTKNEYKKLVDAAEKKGNERLAMILQTICSTGIRISELKYITIESLKQKRAEIDCKGKQRIIFLPGKLVNLLRKYAEKKEILSGPIFITRNGKAMDRSNIWREMKKLCASTEVEKKKVFPHNLRSLFARTYYSIKHDITKLADILGHSNIDTTRIYVRESGRAHERLLEQLGLVFV